MSNVVTNIETANDTSAIVRECANIKGASESARSHLDEIRLLALAVTGRERPIDGIVAGARAVGGGDVDGYALDILEKVELIRELLVECVDVGADDLVRIASGRQTSTDRAGTDGER